MATAADVAVTKLTGAEIVAEYLIQARAPLYRPTFRRSSELPSNLRDLP